MARMLTRALMLALASTMLLGLLSGAASALRSLEIRPNGEIVAEFLISINESAGLTTIECNLRLNGMFINRVPKMTNAPMGAERRLEFTICRDNFGRNWTIISLVEPGTPAPVLYNAILGTLPNITGILATAQNVGLRVTSERRETECLFRGNLPFLISRLGEPKFNAKTFLTNRLNFVAGRGCGRESWIELEGTLLFTRETALEVNLL